jgi:ABC-type sugar transport system substrate-binding protein
MLNTEYDSFKMQLMTDGFSETIGQNAAVTLADAKFCGEDEDKAYETVKQALTAETPVQFIFAQSAVLGRGALRAISETSAETHLVVFGGDMDIIGSVASGDIYAALFIGPGQLAAEALSHANKFVINASYAAPQFDELTIGAVTAENAAEYLSDTLPYAQVKSE